MANFLLIGDPDAARRGRMLRAATDRIAFLGGLVVSSAELPPFAAVWAAGPSAPVSVSRSGTERLAIVWGEPRLADGALVDAGDLGDRWAPPRERIRAAAGVRDQRVATDAGPVPDPFDGFFAAALLEDEGRLVVGADLVGVFPVYHAERDGAVLVGSSPELFRLHPLFPARLDPRGLGGLLLTHAPHAGRTLLEGVRRLSPGCLFRWSPSDAGHELRQYRIPEPADDDVDGDAGGHVRRLDGALDRAVRRHAPPGEEVGLLLSGGRDSRLLAGYLSEQGTPFRALTFGRSSDHEVRCARAVARTLEVPHRVFCAGPEDFLHGAGITARWEHLVGGFTSVYTWAAVDALRGLPPRVVTGHLREIREIDPLPSAFPALFERANRYGIAPETLKTLLLFDDADMLVEDLRRSVWRDFEARAEDPAARGWRFFLAHEWRSHAGSIPWRFAFGSWPAVPAIDREVLATIAALPDASIASRRGQDRIFRERFPSLARLPLDRNSDDPRPIVPTFPSRVRRSMRGLRHRLRRSREAAFREDRYYYRMYDLDGEGWRKVRRLAEPHRDRLADVLDMDELARLVPPPDEDFRLRDAIVDGHGPKLLLGLMLWSRDHLP